MVFNPKPSEEDESCHFIDNGHKKRNLSLYLDEISMCKRRHNVGHWCSDCKLYLEEKNENRNEVSSSNIFL